MPSPLHPVSGPGTMQREPGDVSRWIEVAALIGAAALIGFGIILWIAANWDDLGKWGRFALAGGAIAASALVAGALPKARVAACLVGVLATGGLLALVGQTYQTGADAWQLFAVWALLALPWSLAARHDAVWLPWVVVAITALPLWAQAEAGWGAWTRLDVQLPVWLVAGALTALLSPWLGLERWLGSTRWSFRTALVLALSLVATATAAALTGASLDSPLIWLGFLLIGLTLIGLILQSPFDLPLLAAATLAMDVLLILLIGRVVLPKSGSEMGSFLLIGIISAGIVAGSAVALLRVARERDAMPAVIGGSAGETGGGRTWPIAVVSGIGAIFAAIPLLIFGFMAFGVLLERGAGAYIVGILMLGGSLAAMRAAAPLSFNQQLGVIGLAVGFLLVGFGLFRDLPYGIASLTLAALLTATAWLAPARWLAGLLGAAVTACLVIWLATLLVGPLKFDVAAYRIAWMLLAAAASAALLGLLRSPPGLRLSHDMVNAEPFATGWLAATLLGLMWSAGPTFMLGPTWGASGGRLGTEVGSVELLGAARIMSVLCAVAGLGLLMVLHRQLTRPVGLAVGAVTLSLSAFSPVLGPTVLALATGLLAGRRAVAILAAIGFVWAVGSFYYWLAWPLAHKAYLLASLGTGLAAVCLLFGERPALPSLARPQAPTIGSAALVGLAALSTAGVVGHAVTQNERVIASGRTVYVPLAPVDPRSLMQGDYMALRFALPSAGDTAPPPKQGSGTPHAVADMDDRGIATIVAIADRRPEPAAQRVAIALDRRNGQWSLGPDGFFFKEGTAAVYEKARFGQFRVDTAGRAILVGLADADLKRLP